MIMGLLNFKSYFLAAPPAASASFKAALAACFSLIRWASLQYTIDEDRFIEKTTGVSSKEHLKWNYGHKHRCRCFFNILPPFHILLLPSCDI